jgi:LacI family transcriptional regulator
MSTERDTDATPGLPEAACPSCAATDRQVKAGTQQGAQRYRCMHCGRRYVGQRQHRGYPDDLRREAVALHAGGLSIREVGRRLGLNPRTIVNWVRTPTGEVPAERPIPTLPPDEPPAAPRASTPAKRRFTIVDVAQHAGVSVSTVSNFLNNKGRMSDATRERIRASMSVLHFTPSSLMRAIRQRRTNIIGVVTFGLDEMDMGRNPIPSLLVGINRGANLSGYNVLSYTRLPSRGRSAARAADFLDGHIDGLIWVGPLMPEPELENVARAGLPTVALLARGVPDGVGYVAVDNVGGIEMVVAHLVGLGHRRIAWIGPLVGSDFTERLEGYRRGVEAAGLPWTAELVAADEAVASNWFPEYTADYDAAVDRWLALPDPPTAIVLTSDGWAEWTATALRLRGVRVPEDVAVTGFDDIPMAATMAGGLTTVRQDFREIGRRGVELLAALIDGEPYENCRVTLPATLVARASTLGLG